MFYLNNFGDATIKDLFKVIKSVENIKYYNKFNDIIDIKILFITSKIQYILQLIGKTFKQKKQCKC